VWWQWRLGNIQAQQTKSQVSLCTWDWSVCRLPRWTEPSDFSFVLGFFLPVFFALIFSSRDFFFVSSVGGGCCDEDNKLPLLKALRTLAGRIEPINQLPPLSNCRPLHFFFSFAIPRFCFGQWGRFFFGKLDSEDQLTHNPTLDPRPACAVRMMHNHLCIWIHQILIVFHFYVELFLWIFVLVSEYQMMKPRNNLRTPSDTVLLPCAVNEKAILIWWCYNFSFWCPAHICHLDFFWSFCIF